MGFVRTTIPYSLTARNTSKSCQNRSLTIYSDGKKQIFAKYPVYLFTKQFLSHFLTHTLIQNKTLPISDSCRHVTECIKRLFYTKLDYRLSLLELLNRLFKIQAALFICGFAIQKKGETTNNEGKTQFQPEFGLN